MIAGIVVAIGWLYVVTLMAVAEATATEGSLIGALLTVLFYGLLPLSIVLYLMGAARRRPGGRAHPAASAGAADPDRGDHAAGDAVTPERKEP